MACGILVPRPGIEPVPPAVEAQSLNHWTTREILKIYIYFFVPFAIFLYQIYQPPSPHLGSLHFLFLNLDYAEPNISTSETLLKASPWPSLWCVLSLTGQFSLPLASSLSTVYALCCSKRFLLAYITITFIPLPPNLWLSWTNRISLKLSLWTPRLHFSSTLPFQA